MLSLTLSWKMAFVLAPVAVGLLQPTLGASVAAATPIVLAVEYTFEERSDEDAGNAIEAYLQFLLSRIPNAKAQRLGDYTSDCSSSRRADEGRACALPDFLIQIQIAERRGEFQISGAINKNVGTKKILALDVTRGKVFDLSEGLWRVTKNIVSIVTAPIDPAHRQHVVIACFGSAKHTKASEYAQRLPKLLETQMVRAEPRIRVSIKNDAGVECSPLDGLQDIANVVNAAAVLSGTVYPDEQGGLFVVPYLLISGASRLIQLPQLSIPVGGNATYDVSIGEKLATFASALIGSSSYADLVRSIGEGAELSYYLDHAKRYLSSSPPDYDAADALLELAVVKSPAEEQAYRLLASSLSERGQFAAANTVLRAGIKQIPNSEALFVAWEDVAAGEGNLQEALHIHQEALKAGIPEEGALLAIARTYISAQSAERSLKLALEYALRAASINSTFVDAYLLAGQISEAERDFEGAEMYYRRRRALPPTHRRFCQGYPPFMAAWQLKT